MTITEFEKYVENLFPVVLNEDIIGGMEKLFNDYIQAIKELESFDVDIQEVQAICDSIIKVMRLYKESGKSEAFTALKDLMGNINDESGLFGNVGAELIPKDSIYYRGRAVEELNEKYEINDIFHVPYSLKSIVPTSRYGYKGEPCLYVGSSLQCIANEINVEKDKYYIVSAFRTKDIFKLFNMCIPEKTDYSFGNLKSTIYRLPLVLASSIQNVNSEKIENNLEYAIPQMLTDLIKQENRRLAESRIQKSYDLDTIWGIIFSSSKLTKSQSSDKIRFMNIVLPVIETNGDTCSYIASLFSISEPYLIPGSDIYDGDAIADFEKLHSFEEKILIREFSEIKYLLVNSFSGDIEIDWQGHPEKVDIKSSCEWKIKLQD